MVVTSIGKSGLAWILAGYSAVPGYIAIGSGSGAVSINNTGLAYESDRNPITGSPSVSILNQVGYVGDFNSVEMSGTLLREFGLFIESSGGKCHIREGFTAVTFDGTNELQVNIQTGIF